MRFFALVLGLGVAVSATIRKLTPQEQLRDYVNAPDDSYAWEDTGFSSTAPNLLNNFEKFEYRLLELTSQTWMEGLVRPSVWKHQLAIVIPKDVQYTNMSAIYVTGGGDSDGPPSHTDEDLLAVAYIAQKTRAVCAVLYQIPNQPSYFKSENYTNGRTEDHFVAYTWMEYIRSVQAGKPEPRWINLFPMAKAVSSAMTAVTEYTKKAGLADLSTVEKPFIIAGASKRGWTTWMSGASDDRVAAIIPIVMDMLNFTHSVAHMVPAYGGWTFAFEPYKQAGITDWIGTPVFDDLSRYLDPLNYKQYLTMPKLVVDATGDEFFMPDDDWYWWGDLEGETYRLIAWNAEHSEATGLPELLPSVTSFGLSIINPSITKRPVFDWTFDKDKGTIVLTSEDMPQRVLVHFAKTDTGRRDFRLVRGYNASLTPPEPCAKKYRLHVFGQSCLNLGVLWSTHDITAGGTDYASLSFGDNGESIYTVQNSAPADANQWQAMLVSVQYPRPFCLHCDPYIFTTQISIMPNTMPFPAFNPKERYPLV